MQTATASSQRKGARRVGSAEVATGTVAGLVVALALAWQPAASAEAAGSGTPPADAPIFAAAGSGNLALLGQLVDGGASVDAQDRLGQTPLVVAILAGQDAAAEYLIAHKAGIGVRTAKGMTPLHAAAYTGDAALAAKLIDLGADPNDQANIAGITPLHAAAEEDHLQVATLLIQAGADPSLTEVNGYTAGSRAGWREHWDVMKMLLAAGDKCQPEELAGTALHATCMSQAFQGLR